MTSGQCYAHRHWGFHMYMWNTEFCLVVWVKIHELRNFLKGPVSLYKGDSSKPMTESLASELGAFVYFPVTFYMYSESPEKNLLVGSIYVVKIFYNPTNKRLDSICIAGGSLINSPSIHTLVKGCHQGKNPNSCWLIRTVSVSVMSLASLRTQNALKILVSALKPWSASKNWPVPCGNTIFSTVQVSYNFLMSSDACLQLQNLASIIVLSPYILHFRSYRNKAIRHLLFHITMTKYQLPENALLWNGNLVHFILAYQSAWIKTNFQ